MNSGESPTSDVLRSLARDARTLLTQEGRLVLTEVSVKAQEAAKSSALVLAGGALIHAGILCLVLAAAIAAQGLLPLWASASLAGSLATLLGGALILRGTAALRNLDPLPSRALDTVRGTINWNQEQV